MLRKTNLVLGFMLIMLFAMSTNLMAATLTVGSGQTYSTITAAIAAATNGDIIDVYGTITEAGITVNKNLTIQGQGAGSTIVQAHVNQGDATDRVFYISTGTTVTIEDMTIRNGKTADEGGGIYHYNATLTLNNCTVSGNTSNAYAFSGGGLFNENGESTVTNCTFANNSAPNIWGGGIFLYAGTLYIKNTIIANNSGADAPADYYYSGGTLTDNGYNIVETTNVGAGSGGFTNGNNNNIVGEQASLNLSSTLDDNNTLNGTKTLKTTSGSVAINKIPFSAKSYNDAPTTDQRGAGRNGDYDIGAYEYWDDAGSLPVTLSTFTAQFIENTPTLYWTTQSETDNMGWFVYRNIIEDFTTSEKISEFIEGHGTTTQQQSYLYEDRIQNPEVGDTYYYWLESIDYSGIVNHYDKVAVMQIPDIHNPEPNVAVPSKYGLQSGPNPFNSNLSVSYMLPQTDMVRIEIYNMHGQLIAQFNEGLKTADKEYTLEWNGKDIYGHSVSSGVLLIKLITSEGSETKKAILLR